MSKYGKPGSKAAALREAVHQLLLDHAASGELPTSNRFLYYELVQRGVLDKEKTRQRGRGSDQDLSDASKWLRDEGFVPWSWIVDETRSLILWEYADSVAAYLRAQVAHARIDCWDGQPPPLILCESRTFGGVLTRTLAGDYLCPVAATNGQVGGFLHTNVVPTLLGNTRSVLYVGDFDHQGAQIEQNTRRVLVREAGDREWTRVALTADQAVGLEVKFGIDRRYKPARTAPKVEVEALGQSVVTGIVRDALDELLPEPLDVVREREDEQRADAQDRLAESL